MFSLDLGLLEYRPCEHPSKPFIPTQQSCRPRADAVLLLELPCEGVSITDRRGIVKVPQVLEIPLYASDSCSYALNPKVRKHIPYPQLTFTSASPWQSVHFHLGLEKENRCFNLNPKTQ